MRFDRHTALVPIDVQRGFDHPQWPKRNNPAMEANGQRLLAAWRAAALPLIHVRHDSIQPGSSLRPDHPGNAFRPGFEPLAGEAVVGKSVNAAFIGTDLDLRLRRLDIRQLVLFGISTDMCVSTTARVAANLGYEVIVVGDACACFELEGIAADEIHRAHLATLNFEFAQVVTTDELVAAVGRA
jgi:nicotinamidase-related amidase